MPVPWNEAASVFLQDGVLGRRSRRMRGLAVVGAPPRQTTLHSQKGFPVCGIPFFSVLLSVLVLPRPCASCSELDKFERWVDDFMSFCEKGAYEGTPQDGQKVDWFADCDWVTCECLWQSLKVPVPTDEVTECYETGMRSGRISLEHQQFTLAILEKCRMRTEVLSAPCAVCDQYSAERPECYNGTAIRTVAPASMRGGGTNQDQGSLGGSSPTQRPIATAAARRRWGMSSDGGSFLAWAVLLLSFLAAPGLLSSLQKEPAVWRW